MMTGFKPILAFWAALCVSQTVWAVDDDFGRSKEESIQYLKERKKAFEQYLRDEEARTAERQKWAFQQKEVRSQEENKREQARRQFERSLAPFPVKAYRDFLAQREQRLERLNQERKKFGVTQKELKKLFESKEYNISGKKEYRL